MGKVFGNNVHHTSDVGIYVDAWQRHTHHIQVYGNVVHDVRGATQRHLVSRGAES